jgi:outer membrane protein assembly factor BamB
MILAAVTACCSLISPSTVTGQENWTNYRGPTGQGHVASTNLPTEWGENSNVTWKTETPGKAWSTPAVWNNRIWLTNATEDGTQLTVLCVDKNDGRTLLRKRVRSVVAPQYCHPFNSYASPSPTIDEGRVYVSFGAPYTGCLDATTGDVIWERTDFVCNHFRGAGSSPFIYRNLMILHFDGSDHQFVVAMNKRTGETVWKTPRSVDFNDEDPTTGLPYREGDFRKAFSTPIVSEVAGKPILISLASKAIYAYAPESGEEIWRVQAPNCHSGACRPVLGHGLVFSPMGSGDSLLLAIRPDGQGDVTDTHIAWQYTRAVPKRASLLVVEDLLFLVSDDGVAACVEARTGEEIWRKRLGGNYSSSPIHANGLVYFFDQDGKATVIEASRDYTVVAENVLDDGFMASPAVSGDSLFLRTRTHLYRIDAPAGS